MKRKSFVEEAFFAEWKTPLSHFKFLDFNFRGLLQTNDWTHFLFVIRSEHKAKAGEIHVMTIERGWPYRIIEEGFAIGAVGQYLARDPSKKRNLLDDPISKSCTWKLWGTSFIREIDMGRDLKKSREETESYLIQAPNEWVEVVSLSGPPRWQLLKNMTVKSAMRRFLDEDYKST